MNKLMLITGCSGFIGQHAKKYFNNKGFDVIGCSRTYYGDGGDHRQCDLTDWEDVGVLFQQIKPNYILHLAGVSSPKIDGKKTLDSNIASTYNLLNFCPEGCRVIFASTVLVYGSAKQGMKHTEKDLLEPESFYGASKIAGESIVNTFTKQGKISSTIFRIPAVVGTNLTHGMLADWLVKVRNETKLKPIGEYPGPSKPYIYIDDLLSAFEIGLELNYTYNTYNVSPHDNLNVHEVAELVLKTLDRDIPIEWGTSQTWKGDVKNINVLSTRLMNAGWSPKYTSKEAIVKAIS
jgi:UDP-glucose 4-epimerase